MKETLLAPAHPETAGLCYTFEVALTSGPVEDAFFEENPVISRTIQIRGAQTLEDLHDIIFTAFDREDDTPYEFRIGGGSHGQDMRIYTLSPEISRKPVKGHALMGDVTRTRIGDLGLKPGEMFTYWFDFDDDWMHQITVVSVDNRVPPGKFPRIISRIGDSPAQYGDLEEEDADAEFSEDELWNVSY